MLPFSSPKQAPIKLLLSIQPTKYVITIDIDKTINFENLTLSTSFLINIQITAMNTTCATLPIPSIIGVIESVRNTSLGGQHGVVHKIPIIRSNVAHKILFFT